MSRRIYDIAMATGLLSCTAGTAGLAGTAWAAIVFGGGLIALTLAGALLGNKG